MKAQINQMKNTMPFVETLDSDGVYQPTGIMPLTSINGVPVGMLPDQLDAHVDQWIASNHQQRGEVLHGLFPIGMVQRWIERATKAENHLEALFPNKQGEARP